MVTLYHGRGLGAGPVITFPLMSNTLPWHGHSHLLFASILFCVQPMWVHIADTTPSGLVSVLIFYNKGLFFSDQCYRVGRVFDRRAEFKGLWSSYNTFGIKNLTAAAAELAKEVSSPTPPAIRKKTPP